MSSWWMVFQPQSPRYMKIILHKTDTIHTYSSILLPTQNSSLSCSPDSRSERQFTQERERKKIDCCGAIARTRTRTHSPPLICRSFPIRYSKLELLPKPRLVIPYRTTVWRFRIRFNRFQQASLVDFLARTDTFYSKLNYPFAGRHPLRLYYNLIIVQYQS